LNTGSTKRLRQIIATDIARGPAAVPARPVVRSRPGRLTSSEAPPQSELDVLSSGMARAPRPIPPAASLRINVENGDLTYISEPLLMGHYRSSRLSGGEAVMDRALNRAMSASLQRGLYPTGPGTYQVFLNVIANPNNPWQLPRPEAVVVAGLGPEGGLRAAGALNTIPQAVIGWAPRLTESSVVATGLHPAATVVRSRR